MTKVQGKIPVRINPDLLNKESFGEAENADVEAELEKERKRRIFHEEGRFYGVRVVALCICAAIAAAVVISYTLHLILPESWFWLSVEQIERIENFAAMVVVGVVGTTSATYFLKK